jgi:hypothetical protein
MKPLWQAYGLFSLSGAKGRLGGGKKDLSMLFVYSCIDNYLSDSGYLGFVITQSIFKSQGAGDGFRQFEFTNNKNKIIIQPLIVDDLSKIQVFDGATNRTAVFICQKTNQSFNYPIIILEGLSVGLLTGLVGAGGGFLIIPALVVLSKLPMKMAVGTSLLIIAAKSLIGFLGDLSTNAENMDWLLLRSVTALAIVGIFIGNMLSKKIDGNKLKKGFGWFVLVMGVYIIINELFLKGGGH